MKTGKEIELVYENNKEIEQIGEQSQNEAIFKGLIKVLNKLDEDIEYVKISSKAKYIVDAINGEAKVKNANLAFSKFNFIRLTFTFIFPQISITPSLSFKSVAIRTPSEHSESIENCGLII